MDWDFCSYDMCAVLFKHACLTCTATLFGDTSHFFFSWVMKTSWRKQAVFIQMYWTMSHNYQFVHVTYWSDVILFALLFRYSACCSLEFNKRLRWFLCVFVYGKVVVGDKVVLMPANAGQPLHASNIELLDNPGCNEVRHVTIHKPWLFNISYKEG